MIEAAVAAIRNGDVIGLPTDTVYGIGVDPLNEEAVAKLYDIKGRPANKPVGVLVATVEQALALTELGDEALALANAHWPGALTLVVTPKVILPDWVGDSQRRTIGVRVPDLEVALAILDATGPLAVTSANLSGGPETMSHTEAERSLGDRVAHYVPGVSPGGIASTVVDATSADLSILRMGPLQL